MAMTPSDSKSMDITATATASSTTGLNSTSAIMSHNDNFVATAAADLIRQLDAAFGEMNASILAGAMEAEGARKNARVAAELARRFSKGTSNNNSSTVENGPRSVSDLTFSWDRKLDEENNTTSSDMNHHPSGAQRTPPPAPRPQPRQHSSSAAKLSTKYLNGAHTTSPASSATSPPRTSFIDHDELASDSSQNRYTNTNHSKSIRTKQDRTTATHAEEMLQLTLELERVKQRLEDEQMRHDETKSALQQTKQKSTVAEQHVERLLQDMETAREESGRRIDELESELEWTTNRLQTAENDATTAMDICQQADQARDESDRRLLRALEEVQSLKDYIARHHSVDDFTHQQASSTDQAGDGESDTPRQRLVRFQDDEDIANAAAAAAARVSADRPSRAIVAGGRQILRRMFSSDRDTPFVVTHHPMSEAALERRERLRQRLETSLDSVDASDGRQDDASSVNRSVRDSRYELSSAVDALDICRKAAQVLKESGRRLNLSGRWFAGSNGSTGSVTDDIHLETLARHYTTMVEAQLEKKHEEVLGLESLVSIWEQGKV